MAKSFDDLVARTTTKAVRERAARRSEELLGAMLLAEIRKAKRVTQGGLAKAMGIRQPSLSKLEKQGDMQISTLRRIVGALGGTLVINARFGDQVVALQDFAPRPAAKRGQRPKRRATSPSKG